MNDAAGPRLHGEVESPRPLRAPAGKIFITGWCLAEGQAEPPPVRLSTAAGLLFMTGRSRRADVPKLFPGQASADQCGFVIQGRLPAGVYLAAFEAQTTDGSWNAFQHLSLAVESPPLVAEVESPAATGLISRRVHVEGWALHPSQRITELSLRYGHQNLACLPGKKRDDVSRLFPDRPDARLSGFKSEVILSAGRGPLRLKARLADGSVAVARTSLEISVPNDENVGPEIDLSGPRVAVSGHARRSEDRPAGQCGRPLNILFVLYGSFLSNSALQVAALANELTRLGHACVVAASHDLATLASQQAPLFRGTLHADARRGVTFANQRGPDLIHAWTTRENVRRLAEDLRQRHHAKLVVHLEDNEQEILALSLGRTVAGLAELPAAELDRLVPADLSHPRRGRDFLATADGVTVITGRLREFVPDGRPCQTIQPAADERYFFPRPVPAAFRQVMDVVPGTTVLFYHGNVHASNAPEVRELYTAVLQLNRNGLPVTLIRAGIDQVDCLGDLAGEVAPYVCALGQIFHHRHLPPLMALADIFVQPGRPDAFNDYRFPSKLPEFFAIGRPVVLPRTNLGEALRHRTDAYVLEQADAAGIVAAVGELRGDPALADRLARGALEFAARNFSWRRSAETLAKFYASLTA